MVIKIFANPSTVPKCFVPKYALKKGQQGKHHATGAQACENDEQNNLAKRGTVEQPMMSCPFHKNHF